MDEKFEKSEALLTTETFNECFDNALDFPRTKNVAKKLESGDYKVEIAGSKLLFMCSVVLGKFICFLQQGKNEPKKIIGYNKTGGADSYGKKFAIKLIVDKELDGENVLLTKEAIKSKCNIEALKTMLGKDKNINFENPRKMNVKKGEEEMKKKVELTKETVEENVESTKKVELTRTGYPKEVEDAVEIASKNLNNPKFELSAQENISQEENQKNLKLPKTKVVEEEPIVLGEVDYEDIDTGSITDVEFDESGRAFFNLFGEEVEENSEESKETIKVEEIVEEKPVETVSKKENKKITKAIYKEIKLPAKKGSKDLRNGYLVISKHPSKKGEISLYMMENIRKDGKMINLNDPNAIFENGGVAVHKIGVTKDHLLRVKYYKAKDKVAFRRTRAIEIADDGVESVKSWVDSNYGEGKVVESKFSAKTAKIVKICAIGGAAVLGVTALAFAISVPVSNSNKEKQEKIQANKNAWEDAYNNTVDESANAKEDGAKQMQDFINEITGKNTPDTSDDRTLFNYHTDGSVSVGAGANLLREGCKIQTYSQQKYPTITINGVEYSVEYSEYQNNGSTKKHDYTKATLAGAYEYLGSYVLNELYEHGINFVIENETTNSENETTNEKGKIETFYIIDPALSLDNITNKTSSIASFEELYGTYKQTVVDSYSKGYTEAAKEHYGEVVKKQEADKKNKEADKNAISNAKTELENLLNSKEVLDKVLEKAVNAGCDAAEALIKNGKLFINNDGTVLAGNISELLKVEPEEYSLTEETKVTLSNGEVVTVSQTKDYSTEYNQAYYESYFELLGEAAARDLFENGAVVGYYDNNGLQVNKYYPDSILTTLAVNDSNKFEEKLSNNGFGEDLISTSIASYENGYKAGVKDLINEGNTIPTESDLNKIDYTADVIVNAASEKAGKNVDIAYVDDNAVFAISDSASEVYLFDITGNEVKSAEDLANAIAQSKNVVTFENAKQKFEQISNGKTRVNNETAYLCKLVKNEVGEMKNAVLFTSGNTETLDLEKGILKYASNPKLLVSEDGKFVVIDDKTTLEISIENYNKASYTRNELAMYALTNDLSAPQYVKVSKGDKGLKSYTDNKVDISTVTYTTSTNATSSLDERSK